MCRSSIEFPPNGKRCGFGDHLSATAKAEWKVKRAARERELYYIRKARKAGDAEQNTVEPDITPSIHHKEDPVPVTDGLTHGDDHRVSNKYAEVHALHVKLSQDEAFLRGNTNDKWVSTENSVKITKHLLNEQQSDIAYIEIVGEDSNFSVSSVNTVERVLLEDGRIGYFKNYNESNDMTITHKDYGHDVLQSFNNEVVAYRLAQLMGDGYSNLVPETVFREYNGNIGTLQMEAEGEVGAHNYYTDYSKDFNYHETLRRVAIFDYLAGSQDRHHGNYSVINNGHNGKDKVVLIDNGFAFPSKQGVLHGSMRLSGMAFGVFEEIYLDDDEYDMIEKVQFAINDEKGELYNLLSDEQKEFMNKRIGYALDFGGITSENYLIDMKQ